MAHKASVDSCMFCGEEPCDMHKPTEKPARTPRKRSTKTPPMAVVEAPIVAPVPDDPPMPAAPPRAALHAAMRARVKAPTGQPTPDLAAPDPVTDDAIRALAPILHPDEKRNRRAVLEQPRTVQIRAKVWRERHRGIA